MAGRAAELFDLAGEVALVTGASSGIGRRIALALAAAGASVIALGRRQAELERTAGEIGTADGRAAVLIADLAETAAIDGIACRAAEPFGPPSILFNAAGVNLREPPEKVTAESWASTLAVNLTAPFFLARALVPAMVRRGWGRVVNLGSLQTVRAFPGGMAYGASKAGLGQLTRAMAEAWSRHGIGCNAISPGFFPTELTRPVFEDPAENFRILTQTAIGRWGRLEDLDGTVVFLASRASDYVTGQVIFVDGGFSAK